MVRFREKKSEKRKVNKKREIRMRWWNEKRSRKEGRKEGSDKCERWKGKMFTIITFREDGSANWWR